jgi:MoaA/NifB/PqqE/SkfB family radical SAM enzyme
VRVLGSVLRNKRTIVAETEAKKPVVTGLPYYYTVHLNKPCNQQCIMCRPTGKMPAQIVPFERFLALFELIRPVAQHITLIGGEPLMYPRILDVLDHLAEHPIGVTMNTNATLLRPEIIRRLTALHKLELKCSIDAATPSTYLRIRGRDAFERVTSNLRDFSAAVVDRERTRQILIYVVMRENLDEVLPFIDFAASLNLNRVEFHPVRQVRDWQVSNGTGWHFDGVEQSCESFRDEYNDVMKHAAQKCNEFGLPCETLLL